MLWPRVLVQAHQDRRSGDDRAAALVHAALRAKAWQIAVIVDGKRVDTLKRARVDDRGLEPLSRAVLEERT